jgi:predicted lipoprotein with Yx(FWY)xxD motif
VDQALLGNAERGNGSIQVTYGGHPLYLYSGDAAPGDTSGHAFNDVWFLVAPDGEAVSG